jgi:hypothetical protein
MIKATITNITITAATAPTTIPMMQPVPQHPSGPSAESAHPYIHVKYYLDSSVENFYFLQ